MKKVLSLFIAVLLIATCFAGCSSSKESKSENPLIVGYFANDPFVKENGKNVTGFEVDVVNSIFKNYLSGTDYDSVKFVKVDDYIDLGEEDGPVMLIGGVAKDVKNIDTKYSWTDTIVENSVVGVVAKDSKIKSFSDISGANIAYVSDTDKAALDNNSTIEKAAKSVKQYKTADEAFAALDSKKADVVVVDEFSANKMSDHKIASYATLKGNLAKTEYAFAFKKWDWIRDNINSALYSMLEDSEKGDVITPMATKAFGYDCCVLDIKNKPVVKK